MGSRGSKVVEKRVERAAPRFQALVTEVRETATEKIRARVPGKVRARVSVPDFQG